MNKDFHIERTATALASVYDCRKYMYQYHTIHRPSSQQTTGCGSWVKLVIELGRVMGHEGQRSIIQWVTRVMGNELRGSKVDCSLVTRVMDHGSLGQKSIVQWIARVMGHELRGSKVDCSMGCSGHGSWVTGVKGRLFNSHTSHGSWVTGSKVDCSVVTRVIALSRSPTVSAVFIVVSFSSVITRAADIRVHAR